MARAISGPPAPPPLGQRIIRGLGTLLAAGLVLGVLFLVFIGCMAAWVAVTGG